MPTAAAPEGPQGPAAKGGHRRHPRSGGDPAAAERAATILARLADVMPAWPLVTPEGETRHQDDMAYRSGWNASGLWGGWYVSDLKNGLPLVRAFDLIHDSGAMQRLTAVGTIERNLIRHMAEHYLAGPMTLGNLSHYALQALPLYGMAIGEPRYVHVTVQRYRYILNASYYADGFWHEGAPGYHRGADDEEDVDDDAVEARASLSISTSGTT